MFAEPSGRTVYGGGLRFLAFWHCVFESRRGRGYHLWVLCVFRERSLRWADHSSGGVLPTVLLRCVWSRNFNNGEPMARAEPQRQRVKKNWAKQFRNTLKVLKCDAWERQERSVGWVMRKTRKVLQRIKEEINIKQTTKWRKANWMGVTFASELPSEARYSRKGRRDGKTRKNT